MRNSSSEEAGEPAGGVVAVTRALSLMEAFEVGESALSLAELSRRAAMHKTTALRLARTRALSQYMVQTEDGQWRLGPAAGRCYDAGPMAEKLSFDLTLDPSPLLRRPCPPVPTEGG